MKRTPGPPALPGLFPAQPAGSPASPAPFNAAAFNPAALLQDAVRAHDAGRLDEAERGYRLALKLAPDDAVIPAHLGTLMLERDRWQEGVDLLGRSLAIDPRQAGMLTNRGNGLIELGRFDEAMASYAAAIALQPAAERANAFNNLGNYLHGLGRSDDAVAAYDRALALKPKMAEAWGNRGIALIGLQRLDDALASLDRALVIKPGYADALTNRGIALYQSLRPQEAVAAFDLALALNPDGAEIHNNKGLALQALGRLDEALACADRAVALRPDMAENLNNRGMALQAMGRRAEALAAYDQAVALKPDYPEPYWNKSLVLILLGDYAAGWRLFEWRWKRAESPPELRFDRPLWLGEEPLAGKTLLLHAEQGLGDTLQMLRYAPLLARRGATVVLSAPAALVPLAASVDGIDRVLQPGEALPPFDLHSPLMSLPLALGTRIDTIPAAVPYLSAPAAKLAEWRTRLGPGKRQRIGLAWAGNPAHRNDANRSIALKALLPLLDADADFFSLQKDYRPADEALMRADGRIRSHAEALEDFTDTAALVEQMDLMISVDTSVAHLAGALGKPVFVLLPWVPDYRWGLERADSPWYPTARLFRQARAGDWDGVVAEVVRAIATGPVGKAS
jgi:tetratricopeptide (TPR) repeat protein